MRGEATTIEAPVVTGSGLVAPSSGTVTIYDGGGAEIVSAAAVTITDSVATYSVLAATTTSLSPASDWWVLWSLTVAGATMTARNRACLVAYQIRPPVSNRMVLKREPTFTAYPSGASSWQDQIEEAWDTILCRLFAEGKNPHQITNPYALRGSMLCLTLAYICEALATYIPQSGSRFVEKGDKYRACYEEQWAALRFDVDTDDDGAADATNQAAVGVVYTSRPGAWRWGL